MGGPIGFHRCAGNPTNPAAKAPNPDPRRWMLLNLAQYPKACVVRVKYLDCTNFEGEKVMVYSGDWERIKAYADRKGLDPHFTNVERTGKSDQHDPYSPIARFVPTSAGWDLACSVADALSKAAA